MSAENKCFMSLSLSPHIHIYADIFLHILFLFFSYSAGNNHYEGAADMVIGRALVQRHISKWEDWTTRTFTQLSKQTCHQHLAHRREGGITLSIGSEGEVTGG